MVFENSLAFAREADERDELKLFRNKFIIPEKNGKEQIYFLGNSLGLQPKSTRQHVADVLDQWSQYGVESFFYGENPWLRYHDKLATSLAAIIGALDREVVIMNQLTINLHLMMVTFYKPHGKRKKILCEAKAFPSDQYMLETYLKHLNLNPDEIILEVSPRDGEHTIRTEDILEAIQRNSDELALVFMGGVNYYTGQLFDIKTITAATHRVGAVAGYDLAHAVGNVPLYLHDWNVDFACWCHYKYLNSGPGAVGGAFIHERFHHDNSLQRLGGWWGYNKQTRFEMKNGFKPITSAEGWQLSTPSMILFACLKASLEIFEQVQLEKLFKKGSELSSYLLFLLDKINCKMEERVIQVITPHADTEKGSQVSLLMLKDGKRIFNSLTEEGIFADWREPNVIRVAPVPLYNTFEEVWRFAQIIDTMLEKH